MNSSLHNQLAKESGKEYHLLTGRGTTAIYLIAKQKLVPGDRMVVPPIICPHVVYGLLLAGIQPVFADVNSKYFTLDYQSVKDLLENDGRIRGIVLAEVFGHQLDKRFEEFDSRSNFLIIYDRAQSFGNPSKLRLNNAVEIHSFGYSKPVDAGVGGLIALNDRTVIDRMMTMEAALPEILPVDFDVMEVQYRDAYYSLMNANPQADEILDFFGNVPERFKKIFLFRNQVDENRLLDELLAFPAKKEQRLKNQKVLTTKITAIGLELPRINPGDLLWRLTFRVPAQKRQQIIDAARAENLHISAWYPDCSGWFNGGIKQPLPNASQISKELINLWTDQDDDYAEKVCRIIERIIHE